MKDISAINFEPLYTRIRAILLEGRRQAVYAVNVALVETYWNIGRMIVEEEQGGKARADYGQQLLAFLSARLTGEFGEGFDASNLRYMRLFYTAFPIRDALRHELTWTHYRIRADDDNPTIGIILCGEKDAAVVKYSILEESRQVFASKYKLYLPTEEELARELQREMDEIWVEKTIQENPK